MAQAWPPPPLRRATGTFTNVGNNSVSFPAGVFDAAPVVVVQQIGARGSNSDVQETVSAVTSSGFTLSVVNTGGYVSGGSYQWVAMQL